MLASIAAEATSTRARRVATYTATTLGGAWLLGKYAVGLLVDGADKSRKEAAERHDLANRFGLALQDAQFTVLALVPTVATQLAEEIDVEARSRQLVELAQREREERNRVAAEEAAAAAAAEEAIRQEEETTSDPKGRADEAPGTGDEPNGVAPGGTAPAGQTDSTTANGHDAHHVAITNGHPAPQAESSDGKTPTSPAAPTLNPAAPAFQPRFAPSPSPPPPALLSPPVEIKEDFPALGGANGAVSPPAPVNGNDLEHSADAASLAVVGKSWAEIVKKDAPSAENGTHAMEEPAQADGAAPNEGSSDVQVPPTEAAPKKVKREEPVETETPRKTKGELWYEIKTLSFTRLITSIYVLVLLVLQTHVQLALLGRGSYVSSLLSTLPPRTPSPPRRKRLHAVESDLESARPADGPEGAREEDLEKVLYDAKRLPSTPEDQRETERRDVERKYLTFSWWLLHEGWKVVEKRVQAAVEEVVGPMGLKAPLVYGELGALFGEIRRRVDRNPDGSLFDFSAALHPPTRELELKTLVAGGFSIAHPTSEPSSPPGAAAPAFPPSPSYSASQARSAAQDPIGPALRALLHETSDALDSPDAALVRALSLDSMFSLLLQRLEPAFVGAAGGAGAGSAAGEERGARFEDVSEKTTRLASLLPFVTKLAGTTGGERGVLSHGVNGNEFVEALEDVRELRDFCAILYGSWDTADLERSCGL